MKFVLALTLISLATAATACSDGAQTSRADADATATETAATTTAAATEGERVDYEAVRFRAEDGVELVGRLWGEGDVAVVLAHGFSRFEGQDTWLPFPKALADRGYMVLTFNFRGFCDAEDCSAQVLGLGETWKDVRAAIAFAERRGARKVFLVGASMGGLAVLRVAAMPGVELAGVVSLSTPQYPAKYYRGEPRANDVTPARLKQIDEPKLFIAGKGDIQRPGTAPLRPGIESVRFAEDARRMYAAAAEPKQLALVDSSFHSSWLLTDAPDQIVRQTRGAVFRFLRDNT